MGKLLDEAVRDAAVGIAAAGIAEKMTEEARSLEGPVAWITGNAMMPPLRNFPEAEEIYQAAANDDGELFAALVERVEELLRQEEVYLGCPDYDNALYVVDLRRWKYVEEDTEADDLNDEWERIA